MRTLNLRGALCCAAVFLGLAVWGCLRFPADTDVHFSVQSGFYDAPVVLKMTCAVPGADIYYTTDGSVPTPRSRYYDGPLTLESVEGEPNILSDHTGISDEDHVPEASMVQANVIRAAAFWQDGGQSSVTSATYFIGIDREAAYGSVPVVSLLMEEADLFDYETGIYTLGSTFDEWYALQESDDYQAWEVEGNFSNRGREWERPVYAEYLPADGSAGFSQEMGVRIKGGATRILPQKSLRLTARREYGLSRVQLDLFGHGLPKKLVLRSGGNDCNYAKIRDPLIQALAQDMRFATQRGTPCVVLINGEYWGLYTLTEEYDSCYLENVFGIDPDNAVVIKRYEVEEGQESDLELFGALYAFITENDMSLSENYLQAAQMLDMGSFADYFALQFYVDNVDSVILTDNNWQMWRARTLDSANPYADTRWRMMLYDVDSSADLLGTGLGYQKENLTPTLLGEDYCSAAAQMLRALYRNADFRRELVTALCDVRNIHFSPARFSAQMQALRSAYEPLMADSLRRFGPQGLVDWGAEIHCANELDQLEVFFQGRWQVFPQLVQQALGLSAPVSACITQTGAGMVRVNHAAPDLQGGYTGQYFPECPITLTALENGEARFVRWEAENCTLSDPFSAQTSVSFEGDFSVQAVFE